jgi:TolB-like protein/Flp pilus assembly protein TadD
MKKERRVGNLLPNWKNKSFMSFFDELKRRNVFRVAIGYVITAWLLLQVVDLVLENINAPDWVMQVFMLALAIGFPLAVFFAWAFEMTPEGVKRESDVDRSHSIARKTGRKMDRNIMIAMALALAYFAYDKFSGTQQDSPVQTAPLAGEMVTEAIAEAASQTPKTDEKSIAVLPLVNRSVNAEDAFFADGLHDEILTQLSRISALKVISRTSVMGYAGTTKRMPEIGKELGVATLLEGGVQRSGDRVRINVQLIEAATDEHLWAEVYDRELTADNLFDIQSDITRAIADALHAVLSGEEQQTLEQKPTENLEAYAYYLRGKADAKGFGRQVSDIDKTIASFQKAIELDPQFAAAYASLSIDWAERYWGSNKLGSELDHALKALQQAQALAPESPETLTAEGYYHYWGHLNYTAAITAFNRALKHEPGNYHALRGKGYVLRRLGKPDEAITTLEKVVLMDPLDSLISSDLGYTLLHNGQIERATVMMDRSLKIASTNSFNIFTQAELFLVIGALEKAAQVTRTTTMDDHQLAAWYLDIKLLIARAQSDTETIDHLLDSYLQSDLQGLGPRFSQALVYLDRGEQDKFNSLLADMQESVETAMRERPDAEATLSDLVAFHGLRKDKARLTEAVKNYHAGVKPDAMRIIENRTIPIAYAIAGDAEALLDYAEELVNQFGPWEFYYFVINPSFDSMRDLPRFQALDKRYRQWLELIE